MTSDTAARVLVVDDSAFARKVIRELLEAGGARVVGTARDGLEALDKIEALAPDVITLDLMMPGLDGLGVLDELARWQRPPAVVVCTVAGADTDAAIAALELGAVALVEKTTSLASEKLYEVEDGLLAAVRAAATARPPPGELAPAPPPPGLAARGPATADVVVVGTSTGGPHALTRLLPALPADFPVPIAIVLHIPPGYTESLARRLDRRSALTVIEARDWTALEPGVAMIARAGFHLKIERGARGLLSRLDSHPALTPHRPSVDILFESAAAAAGERAIGLILTGMGEDGLAGARRIREAGGRVLTESASSCVVWGMPGAVVGAGLARAEAPLGELPALLLEHLAGARRRPPETSP